jgi:hypothetical protein
MEIMDRRLQLHLGFLDGLPLNYVRPLLNPPGQGFPQQVRMMEAITLPKEESDY